LDTVQQFTAEIDFWKAQTMHYQVRLI